MARRLGRRASEVGAELVGESLRRADLAFMEFRSSDAGGQAYIQGTRLAVWQAIAVLRSFEGDVPKAAAHLQWPEPKMRAAVVYTKAFRDEIEEALQDNSSFDFETLSRLPPVIQRFEDVPRNSRCSRSSGMDTSRPGLPLAGRTISRSIHITTLFEWIDGHLVASPAPVCGFTHRPQQHTRFAIHTHAAVDAYIDV